MKRSARILIVVGVIETGLAVLWLWLVAGIKANEMTTSVPSGEAIANIGTIFGGLMGMLAAFALFMWVVSRKKDR